MMFSLLRCAYIFREDPNVVETIAVISTLILFKDWLMEQDSKLYICEFLHEKSCLPIQTEPGLSVW